MTRTIPIGTVLLLCCCLPAAAQATDCGAIASAAKISEVGAFSSMRYTDEHAYGYSVMLWRAGECLFGVFESSQGLAGDAPIGALRDVTYDSKTGHLSFTAKLTTGVTSFKGSHGLEPSRDLFAFDGSLKANAVAGVITYSIQNNPNATSTHANVVLRGSETDAEFMHGSTTYGEWLGKWQPILQRRGPSGRSVEA